MPRPRSALAAPPFRVTGLRHKSFQTSSGMLSGWIQPGHWHHSGGAWRAGPSEGGGTRRGVALGLKELLSSLRVKRRRLARGRWLRRAKTGARSNKRPRHMSDYVVILRSPRAILSGVLRFTRAPRDEKPQTRPTRH
ncbi:hypothetical protein AAFF_G00206530 [Aldrovandia affinis]|uniref:Uncharacterized protein n=1 Tax=Aldrovandia affinis TaxID=143900 RepID=A0AAD7W4T4_9TELE|nr:hypothetical protein AAFF_G00206530 [Aldrovandia affinis]